jgi:hypothetical protein
MLTRRTWRAPYLLAAVLCLGGALLAGRPARAQSLADLAKQEEDRRKATGPPAKVYTNKDLSHRAESAPPPAEGSGTPADAAKDGAKDAKDKETAKDKAAAKAAEPTRDQAYWAGRLKTLQDQLVRDQNYADAMQTRINSLTADFVNRDDPAQRAVIEQNRQKSVAELARLNKSVLDTKKAIADLQEEARRAGVPPGWLR